MTVGGQTTEDLEMQLLLPDLDIFSEATKLKKCFDVSQFLTLKKQNLMSVDGTGTELKPPENWSRENDMEKSFGNLKAGEICKNKKVLKTKIWPSSWSVSIIFSSSRDFKMKEQSYIYIYLYIYLSIYISYSVPFRDLAQCSAPSPWWIIMGNLKSKVSSINEPDLCRQTNSEPPLTCRVYKLMLGNNLTRYNPGSRREESGLVEWFLWGF